MFRNARHRALNSVRDRLGVDALLLTDPADVRWACGFTGSNGWLYWSPWQACFLTDGRYAIQASAEVRDASIHADGGDLALGLAGLLSNDSLRIAFSGDTVTVATADRLKAAAPTSRFLPFNGMLSIERAAKDDLELAAIVRAQQITERVFQEVLEVLRPGLTEREVAAEIVYRHLARGAERMSFDPIVASGPNSALPHARPTQRVLSRGDLVLLDFGCFVDGYASDMTRMVSLGPPTAETVDVYSIVEDALSSAAAAAKSGMPANEVDRAARRVIEDAGYGARFVHSLGHGVGLDIHEWPSVSFRNPDALPEGVVITLEPGIYLEGRFGVRIEDMVRLGPDGNDPVTRLPRDLVIL